jgi:nicastrin
MDHVTGILVVLNRGDRPTQYSPDNVCPNKYSGEETCNTNAPWNPLGNNFLLRDWNVPIFIVNKPDTIHTIIDVSMNVYSCTNYNLYRKSYHGLLTM